MAQRTRQKGRAARVERDASERKKLWLTHGARALQAENRQLRAQRDARARNRDGR